MNAYFFFPTVVTGATLNFLGFMNLLYQRAGYVGAVDLAVAVTGLKGSVPHDTNRSRFDYRPYDRDEYRRGLRTSVLALQENVYPIAQELLHRLFAATSQGRFDPIARHLARIAKVQTKTP